MELKAEHLYHRVVIEAEVDDCETSPYYLWGWAYDHGSHLIGDLRSQGVQAFAFTVRMERDLNRYDKPTEPGHETIFKITP